MKGEQNVGSRVCVVIAARPKRSPRSGQIYRSQRTLTHAGCELACNWGRAVWGFVPCRLQAVTEPDPAAGEVEITEANSGKGARRPSPLPVTRWPRGGFATLRV